MMEQYKKNEIEVKKLFCTLGYDVSLKGYSFFEELVFEVRELLKKGKTEEEIIKYIPALVTEYGSCFHEVGKKNYLKRIDEFFIKRKPVQLDDQTDKELAVIIPNISLERRVLAFSKYLNDNEIEEKELEKVYVNTTKKSNID